ncbi:MAG TPA: hypothetical protein VIQ24_18535 [Pyrinomonadaceae bacterium]
MRENISESGRREVAGALKVYCDVVAPPAPHMCGAGGATTSQ